MPTYEFASATKVHIWTLPTNCLNCKQEDEIIIELVNKFGPKKWSTIAQHLPGRIGKQCRERYELDLLLADCVLSIFSF